MDEFFLLLLLFLFGFFFLSFFKLILQIPNVLRLSFKIGNGCGVWVSIFYLLLFNWLETWFRLFFQLIFNDHELAREFFVVVFFTGFQRDFEDTVEHCFVAFDLELSKFGVVGTLDESFLGVLKS